ncbi:MAG: AAA family ATPase [Saccharofermentans sp.]|nr:AAA family ATPase [Saccharofermentans sp.]
MSAFDKVIGYKSIKEELLKIVDMVKNRDVYQEMGTKLPRGILLTGNPGMGKTLIASCFVEDTGLPAFIIRRDNGNDDFIKKVINTFEEAKANTPSIVILDDMDKFANVDVKYRNAPEYIAVQTGIDNVSGSDVIVFATVNNLEKLPESLVRSGRFDFKFVLDKPSRSEAKEIIQYFLSDRKVDKELDYENLYRMVSDKSCADLESIINKATLYAGMERKRYADMDDLVRVIREEYFEFHNTNKNADYDARKVALHEAAHLVVSEVLVPESVGMVAIKKTGDKSHGGFVHLCELKDDIRYDVLISLASRAVMDLYYSDMVNYGVSGDLESAHKIIKNMILNNATNGFAHYDPDPYKMNIDRESKVVIASELERYLTIARKILIDNRSFLDAISNALYEKETLLYSDVQEIKSKVHIVTPSLF